MKMEKIKVLLIEDNPGDARLVKEMLAEEKNISFEMEWEDGLSKGLKRLDGGGIDVVLLDLNLPDSRGFDTFAKVLAGAPQIPVVVMTGLDDETLAISAVKKGAQDYLIKGKVDSNLLARGIRYAIERKQSEVKLRESETRYRTLFEQSPDGVLIIDPLTTIADEFNETAHRQLGYTREEFKQLRISDYEAKETPQETKYHIVNVLRDGKDEFETLHRTRDGELRNVLVTVQTIGLSGKQVFHCIFHDITERRQAEEALRESERRSREMLQNIQLVGIMLDVHGNLVFCNDYLLNLTGFRREEVIGRNWFKTFIPTERQEETRQAFNQQLKSGIPLQYESDILTKKGERNLISFNIVFLRDLGHNITGAAGVGEDITLRRRAADALKTYTAKLEETNRLKDLFTDIMHHDLMNPLGIIKLATDETLCAQTLDKGIRDKLLMIRRNCDKLIDMTRSAGTYAKLESADKLERSKLDLNEMLRAAADKFKPQIQEKNMKLEFLEKDKCYARVNPIFETVFSNLLSNAIKYSPEGKKIELNIIDEGEY